MTVDRESASFNDFATWFVAQHGLRPTKSELLALVTQCHITDRAAIEARNRLNDCTEWDRRRDTALWAWNAALATNLRARDGEWCKALITTEAQETWYRVARTMGLSADAFVGRQE